MVATSPNGRFTAGAAAINGAQFERLDAIGKNLFAFFRQRAGLAEQCVHVHFGMSGRWAVFDVKEAPEPTPTTRLRLEDGEFVAHLSAMTVVHGGPELFASKAKVLGSDPLRSDADPEALWARVCRSKKCVGLCLPVGSKSVAL